MLNEEFLNGLLSNEEISAEDKIKQIISEHEADTRGLLAKRDELLGSEKKLKEKISGYEKGVEEYNSKIKGLEEMLEKANNGDQKAKEKDIATWKTVVIIIGATAGGILCYVGGLADSIFQQISGLVVALLAVIGGLLFSVKKAD